MALWDWGNESMRRWRLGPAVRFASKPGLAPAGDSLSLASPRESKQREGDPMVWVPLLRCGQPAVLAENGVELDSLRSESLALIRFRLRSSAQPDGRAAQIQIPIRGGKDALCASLPEPDPVPESAPDSIPHPSVCAEERRARRIRDRDCLSRRRVRARPRLDRAPQVALRSVSGGGTQTAGSPFLW